MICRVCNFLITGRGSAWALSGAPARNLAFTVCGHAAGETGETGETA